jgi:ParB family chromosome partitioning protein
VQQWISENRLSTGHAKALLALSDLAAVVEVAKKIIQGGFSVRQAESLVSRHGKEQRAAESAQTMDPNVKAAIHALEQAVGTKVTISESKGKGTIELHFFSHEEMHRLYEGLIRARF